ncbi:Mitochondrial matrix cochaperone [Arachnomyces sp. PD_36]|nr:Mitochondrial matrix cochaperone [Arachnomyces sp. PD_36]
MIPRAVRQTQAAGSAFSFRSISSSSSSLRSASTFATRSRTSGLQPLTQTIKPFPPRLTQRYLSTEKEGNGNGDKKGENGAAEASGNGDDAVQKELEAKKKEIVELKDKYLRSVADFRNLQERTRRDVDAARAFAIQRFGQDLIESIDNLDRALCAVPGDKVASQSEANKELYDLFHGLKMTENVIMNTLKKHGLERFNPAELTEDGKRQKFDPNRHEATFMTKAEGLEDGDIMDAQTKGFILNGRVLRAAKVGVVKNS